MRAGHGVWAEVRRTYPSARTGLPHWRQQSSWNIEGGQGGGWGGWERGGNERRGLYTAVEGLS